MLCHKDCVCLFRRAAPAPNHPSIGFATLLQSLAVSKLSGSISSPITTRLRYFSRLSSHQLKRLQSLMNSGARLVFSSSRSDHIIPLFYQLQLQLKSPERIQFKLAVLPCRCIHGTAPTYLADQLLLPADLGIRTRQRSALTTSLPVRRTRLSTVGERAFPVAAVHT